MKRWRRPRPWAWACALLLCAFFLALGTWQWRRAEWKSQRLAEYAATATTPPTPLGQDDLGADFRPRRVIVQGSYSDAPRYLLDNQIREGRPGVLVFDWFRIDGLAAEILVAQGWIAWTGDRQNLPTPPQRARATLRLQGSLAAPPASGLRLADNRLAQQSGRAKLLAYVDLAEIAADVGRPLSAPILQLDAETDCGYLRDWRPSWMPPERHLGYALQWWALALAVAVGFALLHRPR